MRMRQRDIEHRHIELTLADPQAEYPTEPRSNATHIRLREIDGREFKVWYSIQGPDHYYVWTVAVRNE
ncbi:MAG: hypothetical protein ACYCW6_02255 [Candidatus Xenobia bacterium]